MLTALATGTLYMALMVAAYVSARGTVLLLEETLNRPQTQRLDALFTWWGYPTGLIMVIIAMLTSVPVTGQGALAVAAAIGAAVGTYYARETFERLVGPSESPYDWAEEGVFAEDAGDFATVIPFRSPAAS